MATPSRMHERFARWLQNAGHDRGLPLRLLILTLLWWLLSSGEGGWFWGLPAVVAAALFNPFPVREHWRLRLSQTLPFVPLFIWLSLRSAIEIGARALHPRRPLTPSVFDFIWELPTDSARLFLANLINLMPGTLCLGVGPRAMTVHVLGDASAALRTLVHLEQRVGKMFATPCRNHD